MQRNSARLEDRYATALYELALEAGSLDAVAAELAALAEAVLATPLLMNTLRNPVFGRAGQARALAAIAAKQGAGALVQNFLRTIAAKGRQVRLLPVITAFQSIAAAARGELLATVRTAAPLSDAQVQALTTALARQHGAQSIKLAVTVDPSLLGGFSARVGTRLYDRTLSGQLNRLLLKLKEAA